MDDDSRGDRALRNLALGILAAVVAVLVLVLVAVAVVGVDVGLGN